VTDFGVALHAAIIKIGPPAKGARPETDEINKAIESTETLVATQFGGPVFHRYRGRSPNVKSSYSQKPVKSLEYLHKVWGQSFTFDILPCV
jgi:hypothetical protein